MLIEIGLGYAKETRPLVATSSYSAVNAKVGFELISLLHYCLRMKQAQIELSRSRDDNRHRVV